MSHQDTLKTCEELLATLSAAETHLRVSAALQLDFSSVLKVYRDALTRSRDLVAPLDLEPSAATYFDLGGRDDTDEVLTIAVGGQSAFEGRGQPAPAAGQTAVNSPAVPIDDGPEGTTDDSTPLATDEISVEAPAPRILQAEPPTDDVVIMEEDEAVATEVMTASEARARALAMAAVEDSREPATGDSIDLDDEHTLVVTEDHFEMLPEDTTQPGSRVDIAVEAELDEEDDQGSVDEVIVSKDQARAEARTPAQGGQKATPAPAPSASTPAPAPGAAKPKVKARAPEKGRKDAASAKFYAASAAIPQIRDESTPKPRAAAIKLGAEGRPAEVLGGEDDDEPIAIEGVEDEDALDLGGEGLTLEVDDMSDWEDDDEAADEPDLLELDAEHLEELEEHIETTAQSFSRDQLADTLDRARRAARQGNIEVGVNFFSDVLDADPDNVEAYIGRGRLYLDVGDYARAMSDFTVAEDLDPRSPEPQVAVGDLYFARKDYKKAIEYFDEALNMKPDHAMAFCRRGISHYYRKNYKQALGDLNEAVKLDKDIPNIQTFVSMAKKKAGKPK